MKTLIKSIFRIALFSVAGMAVVLGTVKLSRNHNAKNKAQVLTSQFQTKHFNIRTNLDDSHIDYYAGFFEGFYRYFEWNYFRLEQKKPLEVYLFKDESSYKSYANAVVRNYTPYGFYMGLKNNRIIVNRESGLGTITHELVHYFIDVGFEKRPSQWVHEGIGTFFEKFIGHFDRDGQLQMSFGYFSNWRFPLAKATIKQASLSSLIESSDPEQCLLRSFFLFLHKKGLFAECVKRWQGAKNNSDSVSILEEVYGASLGGIETDWKEWVKNQPIDNEVKLVPSAFVLEERQWQQWWVINQRRLYWDSRQQIYKVKK